MKGLLASLLIAATFPFTTLAAPIVIGYQTGVDPSKVAQAMVFLKKQLVNHSIGVASIADRRLSPH